MKEPMFTSVEDPNKKEETPVLPPVADDAIDPESEQETAKEWEKEWEEDNSSSAE